MNGNDRFKRNQDDDVDTITGDDVDPGTFRSFARWANNPVSAFADGTVPDDLRKQVEAIDDDRERERLRSLIERYEDGTLTARDFAFAMGDADAVDAVDPLANPWADDDTPFDVEITEHRHVFFVTVTIPDDVDTARKAYERNPTFKTAIDVYVDGLPATPEGVFDTLAGDSITFESERLGILPHEAHRMKESDDVEPADLPDDTDADRFPWAEIAVGLLIVAVIVGVYLYVAGL